MASLHAIGDYLHRNGSESLAAIQISFGLSDRRQLTISSQDLALNLHPYLYTRQDGNEYNESKQYDIARERVDFPIRRAS
jgi:hypothetical protein